ncbi:MAG: sigma-70 family RNA polymerase sigma factor [Acidobacteria bacterium]|nr:sigma-70 family RNA polymerase sigma factor [Acidobacteriota bacterium]
MLSICDETRRPPNVSLGHSERSVSQDGFRESYQESVIEASGLKQNSEVALDEVVDTAPGESRHAASMDLQVLVERIQSGDSTAMEDLYRIFSRGVRFYLCRHLGSQEIEDKVHDTFVLIVQAIIRGEVREPERLMGYIRTVVRRQVAAHIDDAVHTRKEHLDIDTGVVVADSNIDPEEGAIGRQEAALMETVLRRLSRRDREILTRFYLDEQPQEQICEEMNLSETQFRLLKSRAKTRFGEIGRKRVFKKPIRSFFVRTSLSA